MSYRCSHAGKSGRAYDETLNTVSFDRYLAVRESKIAMEIVKGRLIERRERYLDFACGTGRILSVLAPFFQEVVGVDISESMLYEARSKVEKASFHVVDLTSRDVDIGRFDLITAFRFFGNAEPDLRRDVLGVLRSKLRHNGFLLLNNHRNPSSLRAKISGNTDAMDLTLDKLAQLLTDTGFEIIKTIPIGAWMLRHRWSEPKYWNSYLGRIADRLTNLSSLCQYSPDMIILARPAM